MGMKQVTLTIEQGLFDKAKQYEINMSKAARQGISAAIEREVIWNLKKGP